MTKNPPALSALVAPHPVPDQHGANLFTTDPALRELLSIYLPADLLAHLTPTLDRLGALAGGALDALAAEADRVLANPTARAELAAQGVQTTGYAQTRFRNQVQAESRRYALLAQQVGIKDE